MAESAQPQEQLPSPERPAGFRQRAQEVLASGQSREVIRRELAKLREVELLRLMHEAAVMDSSPFWREIALRRFIREKAGKEGENGADDGR